MPVEAKPLFRPDVLRAHLDAFALPDRVDAFRPQLADWAALLGSVRVNQFKEQELLPDFLSVYFLGVLGYTGPADNPDRYTLSREHHVQVDGKFADAVLGEFYEKPRYLVALEGKGPKDPLDRPFGGRRMSAVDQGYRYAINLPCDWILVTSIREVRLYYKGCDQHTYEQFETLRKAYEHRDLYNPRPVYENFCGLFQAVNRGNAALGIHAYNGGLFADDAVLDGIQVSDDVCGYFRDLGEYDYRPAHQAASSSTGTNLIDVDILGHIFEQSITDLERLRNELDGLAEPVGVDKHKTRRKKEGGNVLRSSLVPPCAVSLVSKYGQGGEHSQGYVG